MIVSTTCLSNKTPGSQDGHTGSITVTCNNGVLDKPSGSKGICLRSNCFIEDVRITLADGSDVAMGDLKVGDAVRGQTGVNIVKAIPTVNDDRPLYGFNGGEKIVTAGHPFHTAKGWKSIDPKQTPIEGHGIKVGTLKVGDRITMLDGSALRITSIDKAELGNHDLYNPMVSGVVVKMGGISGSGCDAGARTVCR